MTTLRSARPGANTGGGVAHPSPRNRPRERASEAPAQARRGEKAGRVGDAGERKAGGRFILVSTRERTERSGCFTIDDAGQSEIASAGANRGLSDGARTRATADDRGGGR